MTQARDEMAAATPGRGRLRASHADREQVIGALKVAFVEGRLTEDEFDTRLGQVYASRTYAELAEVTADIPTGLTRIQPTRHPWRGTKLAWRTVYAIILPAMVTLIVLPGGRGNPAMGVVITTAVVTYLLFWLCGVSVMVYSRQVKRSRAELTPQSAPGAGTHFDRVQVIGTLKAAFVQGRLTEDEYDARVGQASASQTHADLAALIADIPAGSAAGRAPTAKDVRMGVLAILIAASVLGAVVLWRPGNMLAVMMAFTAAVTVIVAAPITVGLMFDARHQKRSGGQLPSRPPRSVGG